MRPKCSLSGKTSSCSGRNAPPESTRYTQGRRFSSATSCARRCFFTVIGKYVPPFTVASLATTTISWPCTRPMPVSRPAAGAAPSYMPCAASGESSRNGEPGSSSARMRSRDSSLPRAVCFSRALSPPPAAARSSCALRSATSVCSRSALARNSGLFGSIRDSRTGMPKIHHGRRCMQAQAHGFSPAIKKPAASRGRFPVQRWNSGSMTATAALGGVLRGVRIVLGLIGGSRSVVGGLLGRITGLIAALHRLGGVLLRLLRGGGSLIGRLLRLRGSLAGRRALGLVGCLLGLLRGLLRVGGGLLSILRVVGRVAARGQRQNQRGRKNCASELHVALSLIAVEAKEWLHQFKRNTCALAISMRVSGRQPYR